jgi:hypothetical protein
MDEKLVMDEIDYKYTTLEKKTRICNLVSRTSF